MATCTWSVLNKQRPLTAGRNAKPTCRRSETTYSFGRARDRLPSNAKWGGKPRKLVPATTTNDRHSGRDDADDARRRARTRRATPAVGLSRPQWRALAVIT